MNQLAQRRLQLTIQVDRMEREVRRMQHVEEQFQQVVQREGTSVADLRTLVRENAKTIEEIKVRNHPHTDRMRRRDATLHTLLLLAKGFMEYCRSHMDMCFSF